MNVSIIGLGLIGGSLGLALRQTAPDRLVVGWDRDAAVAAQAQQRNAIVRSADTLPDAVADADIVVVATPVLAVRTVFESIAPHLKPDAIVTDVASTKVQVLEWAEELLPSGVAFVGGHPMAGSEQHSITNARADLLSGAVYCLTPQAGTPLDAIETIEALVTGIGARPLRMPAATHDAAVAAVSHLPFLLASALVQLTAGDAHWPDMSRLAATGYRDATRLASGDPLMHRDICLSNAAAIRPQIERMARLLDEVAAHLDDPEYLAQFFHHAREQREAWLRDRERS